MNANCILPATLVPLTLFLLAFLGVPLAVLAVSSFWQAEFFEVVREVSLANYGRLLEEPVFITLILRSLGIGLTVAAITVPVAFVVAYAIRFLYPRQASVLLVLVMASMLSSYLVRIYAWKTILGVNGVINQTLLSLGVISAPLEFLLYGDFAVVVTLTHILVPFAILPIYAALQDVDDAVIEAARDLGSSVPQAILTVILPMARSGLVAAFLFSFILASADYVTPQLVGGSTGMMVGRAIADQFGMAGDPPFGATLSIMLIAGFVATIALLALLLRPLGALYRYLTSRPRSRQAPARRADSGRKIAAIFRIFTGCVLVFLYLPLILVLIFSFNAAPSGIFPIEALTWRWYAEMFGSTAFISSAKSSALVGLMSITGTLLLGVPAAFALSRRSFVLKPAVIALALGPIAAPGIVIGTSLLASLGLFGLHGGIFPTVIAHVLFTLPFVVMVMRARLSTFDWELEEAGRDLGSRPVMAFLRITLPMIAPAMLGASILVAALSLDEFIITNFVIGANSTLPVYIWSQMRTGITPSVNAVASLILVASLALLLLAVWVMGTRSALSGVGGRAKK